MNNHRFFIGWTGKLPPENRLLITLFLLVCLILSALTPLLFVLNEKQFSISSFDLQNKVELEGVLLKRPVPMLRIESGPDQYRHILLVSFGKFGALRDIREVEEAGNLDLEGMRVRIRGHLFQEGSCQGMQLTDRAGSFVSIYGRTSDHLFDLSQLESRGPAALVGEIVDSKCFLGVMKPGFGVTHRSCARNCLDGGIIPLFTGGGPGNSRHTLLILNELGSIPDLEIHNYAGDPVAVCGQVYRFFDWDLLLVNWRSEVTLIGKLALESLDLDKICSVE